MLCLYCLQSPDAPVGFTCISGGWKHYVSAGMRSLTSGFSFFLISGVEVEVSSLGCQFTACATLSLNQGC